jgi:large subunit ribosomal protein L29
MKGKSDIQKMKDEELPIELGKLRERLFTLRTQAVTEKVEDTSQYGKVRKDIARVLTEMTARRTADTSA